MLEISRSLIVCYFAAAYQPDLPGTKRLDLLGRTRPTTPAAFVAEAKWIKAGGGTRNWPKEVVHDLLRLESLQVGLNVKTERALVVGGIGKSLRKNFLEVTIQAGGGNPRIPVMPRVVQNYDQLP